VKSPFFLSRIPDARQAAEARSSARSAAAITRLQMSSRFGRDAM
jgi:hypothetical protein